MNACIHLLSQDRGAGSKVLRVDPIVDSPRSYDLSVTAIKEILIVTSLNWWKLRIYALVMTLSCALLTKEQRSEASE